MTRGKKTRNYTQAGKRIVPDQKFGFRNGVVFSCSEIGETSDADVYIPTEEERRMNRRKARGIRRNAAAVMIGLVSVVMLTVILFKVGYKSNLNNSIISLQNQVFDIENEIQDQNRQIAEARDSARICYKAVQEMGMVNASGADTVRITLHGANGFSYTEGNPAGLQVGANMY